MSDQQQILKPGFSSIGVFRRALDSKLNSESLSAPMAQAILTAMNSPGKCAPNPAVGCVVHQDGKILAAAATDQYGGKHAERNAYEKLSEAGSHQISVTLEPCAKFGNQPPCLDLVLSRAPKEIEIAAIDPDPRTREKSIRALAEVGILVRGSDFSIEAILQNAAFHIQKLKNRPLWICKWAETDSGAWVPEQGVGNSQEHSTVQKNLRWISGTEARSWNHWLRQRSDIIVVGAQTFLKDHPSLDVRDCALPHDRNPVRVVVDPRARLLETKKWPKPEAAPWVWLLPKQQIQAANQTAKNCMSLDKNLKIFVFELDPADISKSILKVEWTEILGRPLQSVMVEGGKKLVEMMKDQGFQFDLLYQWLPLSVQRTPEQSGYLLLAKNETSSDQLFEWIQCDTLQVLESLKFSVNPVRF